MAMDIYLIRHGETDWNKTKRLQGVTDIPLNACGIELAEKTAEGLKDVPFDRIYTSPLIRAKKTAEIIRGDRPVELVVTDGLKEISFGEYEGLCHEPEHYTIPKSVINDPENDGKTFLMASHGAAIRGIMSGLLNLPIAQFWSGTVHKNCGVTCLHVENGQVTITFENRIYY